MAHANWLRRALALALAAAVAGFLVYTAKVANRRPAPGVAAGGQAPATEGAPEARSSDCAACHAEFFTEWRRDEHSTSWKEEEFRAFTDEYQRVECLACHAPRPMLEVGVSEFPQLRDGAREDGVGCQACHAREGRMYGRFGTGGACGGLKAPELGTALACYHCHSAHDLFKEYEASDYARRGVSCQDCHMPRVTRALVGGGPERETRRHVFTGGGHDLAALKTVLELKLAVSGPALAVTVTNAQAAHGVPGEISNRIVRMDLSILAPNAETGRAEELGAYREQFRAPPRFARGKTPSTQIMPGQPRVLRYPLPAPHGKAKVRLSYRLEESTPDEEATPMASAELEF